MLVSWSIYTLTEALRYDCLYYGHVVWNYEYGLDVEPRYDVWEYCS